MPLTHPTPGRAHAGTRFALLALLGAGMLTGPSAHAGLVKEWTFDAATYNSSARTYQDTVSGQLATAFGTTSNSTAGVAGEALSIDWHGSGASTASVLRDIGVGDYTVSLWVYYDNAFTGHSRGEAPFTSDFQAYNSRAVFVNGEPETNTVDKSYWITNGMHTSSDTYHHLAGRPVWMNQMNQWHHVAIGRVGTRQYLCSDGVLIGESTTPSLFNFDGSAADPTSYFGYDRAATPSAGIAWPGLIDEAQVYDEWIGAAGCAELYANPGTTYESSCLTHEWTFDDSTWDSSAETYADSVQGQLASTFGTTSSGTGKAGQAMSIDWHQSGASTASVLSEIGTGDYSISMWVNYDNGFTGHSRGESPITSDFDAYNDRQVFVGGEPETNSINKTYYTTNGQYASTDTFHHVDGRPVWMDQHNVWHHLVIGRIGTEQYLCINGALRDHTTTPELYDFDGSLTDPTTYFGFDRAATPSAGIAWPGLIDQVQVYNEWIGVAGCQELYADATATAGCDADGCPLGGTSGIDGDGDGYCDDVDCDDADDTVHPGAEEVCDAIDQDCDGEIDDVDADGDGVNDLGTGRLELDGSGDWVEVASDAALDFAGDDFTIELWLDIDAAYLSTSGASQLRVLNRADGAYPTDPWWVVDIFTDASPELEFSGDDGITIAEGTTRSSVGLFTDTRTHLAIVVDRSAGTTNYFIDGDLVDVVGHASAFTTAHEVINNAALYIGDTYLPIEGSVDELRIWHTARTPADIAADMCSQLDGTEADLAAYFPFETDACDAGPYDLGGTLWGDAYVSNSAESVVEDGDCDGVLTTVDCDDQDDSEGAASTWYIDTDGDGVGDAATSTTSCTQPTGFVANDDDLCPSVDASSADANGDGCLDGPTISGFTTTANSDGTSTLAAEDGSGTSVTLPAGTTASSGASITTSTDSGGNTVITFTGINLPAGQTKTATVRATPQVASYGYGISSVVKARSQVCVVDSATPASVPTPGACPGATWSADWEVVVRWSGAVSRSRISGPNGGDWRYASDSRWWGQALQSGDGAVTPTTGATSTITAVDNGRTWSEAVPALTSAEWTFSNLSHTTVVLFADEDGDGLATADEVALGTSDLLADTDGDGVTDYLETLMGTGPLDDQDHADPDADQDGLFYDAETAQGTDPDLADTDGDGVDDLSELVDGTDPTDATDSLFLDLDGNGTDDRRDDADGDLIDNGTEEELFGTDPDLADTDGDGISDFYEVYVYLTDPLNAADVVTADSDGDGLDDHDDNCITTDNADQVNTDGDLLGDACDDDDDNDGTADEDETCDTDPAKTEAGQCGCGSADADADADGITDCLEEELTLEATRSHIRWHDTKVRRRHDIQKNMSWASFSGDLELGGGLLAPDLREGDLTGSANIRVDFGQTNVVTVYDQTVELDVTDACNSSSSDNRERWRYSDQVLDAGGHKFQASEHALLRFKNSMRYQSSYDATLPAMSDADNYGRLKSRWIAADESRIRIRWNRDSALPLTFTLNGVALATVVEEADGSFTVTSSYTTETVYRSNGTAKSRVIDVVYPDNLQEGDVVAWYQDADAASDSDGDGSNLDAWLYEHELVEDRSDATVESIWTNAGGTYQLRVPIGQSIMDGELNEATTEQVVTVAIQVGTATTGVVSGEATYSGYVVSSGHWRLAETEEDDAGSSASDDGGGTAAGTTCEIDGADDEETD